MQGETFMSYDLVGEIRTCSDPIFDKTILLESYDISGMKSIKIAEVSLSLNQAEGLAKQILRQVEELRKNIKTTGP